MRAEDALAILKNADRGLKAPPSLEIKLLARYRRRHWSRVSALLVSLAACIALAFYVGGRTAGPRPAARPAPPLHQLTQSAASVHPTAPLPNPVRLQRVSQPPPREIVTEFFPLMDVAPPLGRGQLLRVAVPASEMRAVGLPVREEQLDERVEAEVLVGEEGMARAIRFVSLQK